MISPTRACNGLGLGNAMACNGLGHAMACNGLGLAMARVCNGYSKYTEQNHIVTNYTNMNINVFLFKSEK